MESISSTSVINIFEYVNIHSIHYLNQISKGLSDILTSNDTYWNKNRREIFVHHKKKIKYSNSGVTCLMLRAIHEDQNCIECNSSYSKRHPFYGVPVCSECICEKHTLAIGGLSKTCKKYFIDVEETGDIPRIECSKNFNVMDIDIFNLAKKKYPNGLLQHKIFMREMKYTLVRKKGHQSHHYRLREIKYEFETQAIEMSARIDKPLRKYTQIDMLLSDNRMRDLFGDSIELKIHSLDSPMSIVKRLIDVACIVTFMRKKSLLTDDYETIYDDSHTIKGVYSRYTTTNVHFYEIICQYIDSNASFRKRLKKMTQYLAANTVYSDKRKELAINCCIEDGVDYDDDIFSDFVTFSIGNPVRQARMKREQIFMNQNRYLVYASDYMNYYHLDREDAERNARGKVLSVTNGFPPMMNVCKIDY